jgi:CBS domain containing-hemolysin-like protein
MCRVTPRDEASSTFTLDQVASIVNLSQREGTLEDATGAVSATFEFTIKKARDIAVAMADVVTLTETATVADLERAVTTHGFSRYPIVNTAGEAVGYVHLKDVLTDGDGGVGTETGPLRAKRIRRLETVSPLLDLEDALAQLQQSGVHLARVVDASGLTTGMIFLEDILEELIGRVDDATRR